MTELVYNYPVFSDVSIKRKGFCSTVLFGTIYVWKLLYRRSFFFLINVILFHEFSIATPLTMDMYSWTRKQAVFYNGIILSVVGIESVIVFMAVKALSKK